MKFIFNQAAKALNDLNGIFCTENMVLLEDVVAD